MNLLRPAQEKARKELDLTPPIREATVTPGSGINSPRHAGPLLTFQSHHLASMTEPIRELAIMGGVT
jgi:hypothetical protein